MADVGQLRDLRSKGSVVPLAAEVAGRGERSLGSGLIDQDAEPAPADEAIVKRLVRAVSRWRVFPLQTVPDLVDDAAHHASHYPLVRRQVPIGVSVS